MTHFICLAVFGLFFVSPLVSADSDTTVRTETTRTTEVESNPLTAESQKNNKVDVEITRQIRQKIVKNDSLSTSAHNVKIITQDGVVTLKGPVLSMTEKKQIEKDARSVNGVKSVQNQLNIESSQG